MLRACTAPVERWCDKTMSVLREQQLEACQDRLSHCPQEGIFGALCQDEYEKLYALSYYAKEIRRRPPSLEETRARVFFYAPREAHFLSSREDALVKRMLMGDGETLLIHRFDGSLLLFRPGTMETERLLSSGEEFGLMTFNYFSGNGYDRLAGKPERSCYRLTVR